VASDYITGLVSRDDLLEWTTLQRGKDGLAVVASRRIEWQQPPEEDAGGSPADEVPIRVSGGGGGETVGDEAAAAVRTPETFRDAVAGVRGDVAVSIPSHAMLIRVIDLPPVDPSELASMVELQVDKFSPFPVETMVVSHEVIKRTDENCRVLVAAVRQTVVDDVGEMLRAAGVEPVRVDSTVLGWWRLLSDAHALEEETRQVVVILDGACRDIAVFQDGLPVVVRSLSLDSDASEEDVARDLAADVGSTLMSLEIEHGVAARCSVCVWHRGDEPTGIKTELETVCQCPVSTHALDSLPPVSEGLARRQADGDVCLDLTPQTWRLAEKARLFKKKMVLAAAAVFGVWVFGMGGLFVGLALQNLRLSNLRAEAEEWRGPAMAVRDLRRRVSVIRQYTDRRSSALECLREICLVQPAGVDLTQFSYRKKDVLKIAGEAPATAQIYELKRKLDVCALFGNTALEGPRYDPRRRKQVFEIDISLTE